MRPMRESAREHPQNRPTQTIGARVTEIASGVIDRLRQQRRSLTGYCYTAFFRFPHSQISLLRLPRYKAHAERDRENTRSLF
jgi:hypothetical protein